MSTKLENAPRLGFKSKSAPLPERPKGTDITAGLILYGLKIGKIGPLIKWIEQGKLAYLATLMTEEDHIRLNRVLRTGSPLTRKERAKHIKPRLKRNEFYIQRIIYWRARGHRLFDHTSTDTAVHHAVNEYSKKPLSGAPSLSEQSVYRQIWLVFANQRQGHSVIADDTIQSLIAGMSDATSQLSHDSTFNWFCENCLKPSATAIVWPSLKNQLAKTLKTTSSHATKSRLNQIYGMGPADRIRFLKGEPWIQNE